MAKKKIKTNPKESITESKQNPAAVDVKALSRTLSRRKESGHPARTARKKSRSGGQDVRPLKKKR
jgi:hypothetical protein